VQFDGGIHVICAIFAPRYIRYYLQPRGEDVVTSLSLAQITRGYIDPCSIRRVHNPDDADADANADDCASISIVFRDGSGSLSVLIWSRMLLCDLIRAQLVSQKVLVFGRVMNSSTCLSIG
jgi:hypothetical protein